MKKMFLICCATLLCASAFAQQGINAYKNAPKLAPKLNLNEQLDNDQPGLYNFTNPNLYSLPTKPNDRGSVVTKIKIGSSYNIFSILTSYQQCLSGDFDLNMISFTHRQCASYPGGSGLIQTTFSIDGGNTWDSSLVIQTDTSVRCRYPSGGIYNPPGNTDPDNAFAVIAGPITDGGSSVGGIGWVGNYFCSAQMNGTNNDVQFPINGTTGVVYQNMARNSFSTTSQAKAYVLGADYDINSTATIIPINGLILNTGSFNSLSNHFDWNRQKLYYAVAHDPNDNSQYIWTLGSLAFSQDGMTGYVAIIGRDSLVDYNYPQPLIYKTTDAGATWTYQTPFDFSTVASLTQ